MKKRPRTSDCTKEKYLLAFLLGFGTMLFTVLPMMISEHGYFIYYGDYNAQQIPFYSLANDAVRSGGLGWNWYTDLGSDFFTSYSFYLSGSPFFWLTTLLPRGLVLYSMPVILAVKHGVASLTAYAFIRRFVRSRNAALTPAVKRSAIAAIVLSASRSPLPQNCEDMTMAPLPRPMLMNWKIA